MEKIEIIPPLHDVMIGKIFEDMGTAPAALSLINAVLKDSERAPLDKITALRCEETIPGASVIGRGCRLDVVAETKGKIVNIEVQRKNYEDMIDRSFFQACAILHRSLSVGQKYSEMPRLTMINILDFKPLRAGHAEFHQPIALTYLKGERELASDAIYIHNIELKKFRRLKYDKNNPLHRWLHVMSKGYETITKPEKEVLTVEQAELMEIISMDPGLKLFVEKYRMSLRDPEVQRKYTQYRLAELDYNSDMDMARTEGIEIGMEKGLESGEQKGLEKMLRFAIKQKNIPSTNLWMMAQQAGISNERYEQIRKEELTKTSKPKQKTKKKPESEI